VAQFAHTLHVAVGWNENAIGSDYGFKNEGRHGLWALQLDDLFDHCQRRFRRLPTALDAMVRIEHTNDYRNPWFRSPPPRIACESDAARSSPVIGAVARHDLGACGIEAGNLYGIPVGLGAAVGEEESVDIAGSDFGELGTKARTGFG